MEEALADQRLQLGGSLSGTFVTVILALGILLGFSLGLLSSPQGAARESAPLYDEGRVTSLVEKASPAVVELNIIERPGGVGTPGTPTGVGSGFLVDSEGHILTNNHVVEDADEISVNLHDGRTLEATKLGSSRADDLALLQVDPDMVADIAPLPLGDSEKVKPGQLVVAIGSPFRNFNSIAVGVVSGTGRGPSSVLGRPIPDMIQTDAPLNPGNSGGPLLNSKGEVVGVNSAVQTGSVQELGEYRIGFAVPTNTIANLLPELVKAQELRRPWLGIGGGPVTKELRDSLGLPEGVYVTAVFPDSPAETAGLVPFKSFSGTGKGDVITRVDGERVTAVDDMVGRFNELKPGNDTTLSVFRDNHTIEVTITLAEWPDT